jgi:hypothetical protein
MSIPGHTALSLEISLSVTAAALTLYSAVTIYRMCANMKQYVPHLQDWIWNASLPLMCCLALLAAGVMVISHAMAAMYLVGVVTLAMLFIGVHNAWDLAVWITAERPGLQQRKRVEQEQPPSPDKQS